MDDFQNVLQCLIAMVLQQAKIISTLLIIKFCDMPDGLYAQ